MARPRIALSLIALLMPLLANAGDVNQDLIEAAREALPGETCWTGPLPGWTGPEKWVWTQVCEGKIANFNKEF